MPVRARVINPESSYFGLWLEVLEGDTEYWFLKCPYTERKMRFTKKEVDTCSY